MKKRLKIKKIVVGVFSISLIFAVVYLLLQSDLDHTEDPAAESSVKSVVDSAVESAVVRENTEQEVSAQKAAQKIAQKPAQKTSSFSKGFSTVLSAELSEFSKLIAEVKLRIPTKKELQALDDSAVHFAPEVIQEAAFELARIAQAIIENEKLAPAGARFYQECAEMDTYPNSIRASCFINHKKLIEEYKLAADDLENDPKINSFVKKLAKKFNE